MNATLTDCWHCEGTGTSVGTSPCFYCQSIGINPEYWPERRHEVLERLAEYECRSDHDADAPCEGHLEDIEAEFGRLTLGGRTPADALATLVERHGWAE